MWKENVLFAIVTWQENVRWQLVRLMGLAGWLVLVHSVRFWDQIHQADWLWSRQRKPSDSSSAYFQVPRHNPALAVRAAAQKLSSPLYYNNQRWNSSKPGFGQQKADKTEQLRQESSLITGGFRWASDVERSELQSHYETISHNEKRSPDLLQDVKESAKRIFRYQYFCLVHLGV